MRRDWLTLAFGVGLVGAVVGLSLRQNITRSPAERPVLPESAPAAVPSSAVPAAVPAVSGPEPARTAASGPGAAPGEAVPAVARPKPGPTAPAASANSRTTVPAAGGASLQVQSDVQGASVFLDRQFVGTTPLTLRDVTAGQKQLNVTATGHEGYSANIDVTDGANRVNVEFMKVRLNANVPVVHRHAMGSCQGTLVATVKGLSYDTTNKEDAFAVSFAELDEFEVDYLKKNLRIRRRAGRTWNFTNNNADAIFVFHRDVNKARERLSAAR